MIIRITGGLQIPENLLRDNPVCTRTGIFASALLQQSPDKEQQETGTGAEK